VFSDRVKVTDERHTFFRQSLQTVPAFAGQHETQPQRPLLEDTLIIQECEKATERERETIEEGKREIHKQRGCSYQDQVKKWEQNYPREELDGSNRDGFIPVRTMPWWPFPPDRLARNSTHNDHSRKSLKNCYISIITGASGKNREDVISPL
jgi:hypothetical protein